MSLLNDVLQDLDARHQVGAHDVAHPVSASAAGRVDGGARARGHIPFSRHLIVGGVTVTALVAAWLVLRSTSVMVDMGRAIPPSEPLVPVVATAPSVDAPTTVPDRARKLPTVSTAVQRADDPEPQAQRKAAPDIASDVDESVATRQASNVDDAANAVVYLPLRNDTLPDATDHAPSADRPEHRPHNVTVTKSIQPVARDPLRVARGAITNGQVAVAEKLLRQRLLASPDDMPARELMVGLLVRDGRVGEALDALSTGLEKEPTHAKFLLIKARLLVQRGQGDDAIKMLERSRHVTDGRVQRLQMLGTLYQQRARYARAAESYRELVTFAPSAAAGWAGLAISLDAQGEPGAVDAYRRALRLGGLPERADSYARQRLAELE